MKQLGSFLNKTSTKPGHICYERDQKHQNRPSVKSPTAIHILSKCQKSNS